MKDAWPCEGLHALYMYATSITRLCNSVVTWSNTVWRGGAVGTLVLLSSGCSCCTWLSHIHTHITGSLEWFFHYLIWYRWQRRCCGNTVVHCLLILCSYYHIILITYTHTHMHTHMHARAHTQYVTDIYIITWLNTVCSGGAEGTLLSNGRSLCVQ